MSELGNLSIAREALVSAYGLVAALLGAGLRPCLPPLVQQPRPRVLVHRLRLVGGTGGVAAVLGLAARGIRRGGRVAAGRLPRVDAIYHRHGNGRLCLLYAAAGGREQPLRPPGLRPAGRSGAESPTAEPGDVAPD